jgi:hypothetical protein
VNPIITDRADIAGVCHRIGRFRIKHVMTVYFSISALDLKLEWVFLPKGGFAKFLGRLSRAVVLLVGVLI